MVRNLWRVHGRDRTTGKDKAIGYFVTSGGSKPVAYLNGLDISSLECAADLLAGDMSPLGFKGIVDCREMFPDQLLGLVLIPVRRNGETIKLSKQHFPTAMYRREQNGKLTFALTTFMPSEFFRSCCEEKSGTSRSHTDPNFAGRFSEAKGATAAVA